MCRAVFNFNHWESVKCFINGLGKLSLQYILKLCKVKFYFHLLYAANCLLSDLFWLHYGDCYSADHCLRLCLACDMRLLLLSTSSLKLTVHHSRSALALLFSSFFCF